MKIIEEFTHKKNRYFLIEIDKENYCIQKTYKILFFNFVRFANINTNGTDIFVTKSLINNVTISDYNRAKFIYDCNRVVSLKA